MQINIKDNPELTAALLHRMGMEYAETAKANFVLDIVGEALMAEKAELQKRVEDLQLANRRLHDENSGLRAERDDALIASGARPGKHKNKA